VIDFRQSFENLVALNYPRRITVELTNRCNLNCQMCPRRHMKAAQGFMPYKLFTKIMDEMAEFGDVTLVPFFRGESLLHPHCIEMLAYAKRKNIGTVQFTTNATLLNEDVSLALIDLGLDFISFSVDSIDPETYESIRRGANLKKVLKNIETFCALKKKKNAAKPEIQVSVVRTDNTRDKIEDFVEFWRNRVDRVRVYEEHSQDGNFGSLDQGKRLAGRMPCLKPFTDMVVYWDGSVALCNHDWDRTDQIGDVNQSTISEIWLSETYEKIRSAHKGRGQLEDLCQNCDHWQAHSYSPTQIGDLYVRHSPSQRQAL